MKINSEFTLFLEKKYKNNYYIPHFIRRMDKTMYKS